MSNTASAKVLFCRQIIDIQLAVIEKERNQKRSCSQKKNIDQLSKQLVIKLVADDY